MVKIYLARHGQDTDNVHGILNGHRDGPLTELGREQAQKTARFLAGTHLVFDTIYASPLQRAHETGKIIAGELNVALPVVLEGLIERDFGVMTGQRVSEITALCGPEVIQTPIITYFLSPEGAETFPVLLERGKRVIADVQTKYTFGSVLLVAHGDIGKMIYAAYYGLDWKDVLVNVHFGNGEVLVLAEDSLPEEAIMFHQSQHNY